MSSAINFSNVGNLGGYQGADWISFSPALKGSVSDPTFGAGGGSSAFYRRVGDSMEVIWQSYQTSGGTNGSGTYIIPIPGGYAVDTAKITATTSGVGSQGSLVGSCRVSSTNGAAANQIMTGEVFVYNSSGVWLSIANEGSTNQRQVWGSGFYALSNTVQYQSAKFTVPIAGWSAGGGNNPTGVLARAHNTATAITGSLATIVWTTEDYDTSGALASGVFTVPSTGYYQVESAVAISGTIALNTTAIIEIQKNGTAVSNKTFYAGGAQTNLSPSISDVVYCAASDTLRVQASSSATLPAIVSSDTRNYITITKVSS